MQQIRFSVCAKNRNLSHIYLITTQEQFFLLLKKNILRGDMSFLCTIHKSKKILNFGRPLFNRFS